MSACTRCGGEVTVASATALKYPGWTPKLCSSCHREGATGHQADSLLGAGAAGTSTSTSTPRRSPNRSSPAATVEEHLTLAQVLAKYHDGPMDGVFTDGSCIPNPGPGGWGAVHVVAGEIVDQAYGRADDTTNNRMELEAIARGIELVPLGTPAVVHTDSRLCVDTLTKWAAGWARRGWTRKGGEVANLDLVRPLYDALSARPEISLAWVKAHAGNRWNEYADALATAWARDEL